MAGIYGIINLTKPDKPVNNDLYELEPEELREVPESVLIGA